MSLVKNLAVLLAATSMFAVAVADESDGVSAPVENAAPAVEAESAGQPEENAPAADAGESQQAAAEKQNKRVCKYIAQPGSRLGRKVCMTKDEWERLRRDSQEGVNDLQRQNTAPGSPQG